MPKKILLSGLIALIIIPNIAFAGFGLKIPQEEKTEKRTGYFYEITPGNFIESSIIAFSTDDMPKKLLLYGTDGRANSDGSISYLSSENKQYHIGKWVFPLETDILLGPEETTTIPFKINVPKDTPPGDYAGAIALSSISQSNAEEGATLQSVVRTIVPLYIRVPGNKIHSFDWPGFTYDYVNKKHQFFLNFENTGNTILHIDLKIEIHNVYDDPSKTYIIEKNDLKIPQNDTIELPIKWDERPLYGKFQVTATAVFSEFDLLTGRDVGYKEITKSLTFTVIPWGVIIYAAGLLLLIIVSIISSIIHKRNVLKNCRKYIVQQNDTVDNLAKKYAVDWKQIVNINKLKPPYALAPGSKLLLPKGKNEKK